MRQEKGMQNIIIAVLAVSILVMSVGFALYSQTLNINGTATFKKSNWDVHFDDTSWNETAGGLTATHNISNTLVTYTVTLEKPGDVYTFDINAKNYGTIDAQLKKITMSGLTAAQSNYVRYTVNYGGTNYTTTTDNLAVNLPSGQSATVKVTVEYLTPSDPSLLPTTADEVVNLTVALDYIDVSI